MKSISITVNSIQQELSTAVTVFFLNVVTISLLNMRPQPAAAVICEFSHSIYHDLWSDVLQVPSRDAIEVE